MAGTTISGTYLNGIVLNDPATQQPATVTGSVSRRNGDAILGSAVAYWRVDNFGTVAALGTTGYGIELRAGGRVNNGNFGTIGQITGPGGVITRGRASYVANTGTILAQASTGNGIWLTAGGRVSNTSTTSLIEAKGRFGVLIGGGGNVVNNGTIEAAAGAAAVMLSRGGAIFNNGVLTDIAGDALEITGAAGNVGNLGTIAGRIGVFLGAGGSIRNYGDIQGGTTGIHLAGAGTVKNTGLIKAYQGVQALALVGQTAPDGLDNSGSIEATGANGNGIRVSGGSGTITNSGTIEATGTNGFGIRVSDWSGTITNSGTISGAAGAVLIAPGGKPVILVVEPGAAFVGGAAGGGTSEIVFATGAAVSMDRVSGFETIALPNGSRHVLTLTAANFAGLAGAPITVIAGDSGDTVDASALPAADRIVFQAGPGTDTVAGGAGADVFYAGGGTTMAGGKGADAFVFTTAGSSTVTDFAASDEVVFSPQVFDLGLGAVSAPKQLPTALFVADNGGDFTNDAERFAYDTASGDLFYSADGSDGTAELVAHFDGAPVLGTGNLFYGPSSIDHGIVISDGDPGIPVTVTGTISSRSRFGLFGADHFWTVANHGTIEAGGNGGIGVELTAGGNLTNGSSTAKKAVIGGGSYGVNFTSVAATLTNYGTIDNGVRLVAAGNTVTNLGLIQGNGAHSGIESHGGDTITNTGTIHGVDSTGEYGAVTIRNADGAVIGDAKVGVYSGRTVYVSGNRGGYHYQVPVFYGGTVVATNSGIINASQGVGIDAGHVYITNSGTISGVSGIAGHNGGSVANTSTIVGATGDGVVMQGPGTIVNGSSTAVISGEADGIYINSSRYGVSASTVINFGKIEVTGAGTSSRFAAGVAIPFNGTVINGSSAVNTALIVGGEWGVQAGSISNFGTIEANRVGIAGNTVKNFGKITATGVNGIGVDSGTVTNFGIIEATGTQGTGVGGGAITNFGIIEATGRNAVAVEPVGTMRNFGTIEAPAGTAVSFSGESKGLLVVAPGAVFRGKLIGGGDSQIDFAGGGVANMGSASGFAVVRLGNGAAHILTLTVANFTGVGGAAITIDDGDSGNTVVAASLPASDAVTVYAGGSVDTVIGGAGNDRIFAGGKTVMVGGGGANQFIFAARGDNTIVDFADSPTNEIVFRNFGFRLGEGSASATPRALPAVQFTENRSGAFTTIKQRFAYNTGNGDLSFSASGSAGKPQLVAQLTGAPALAAGKLFFIA